MRNYFNYFTEIEERFQKRRGSLLLLSTLDWALIEAWREADVPVEAVLRGIDDAFDKFDAKALRGKARVRKVNGLAWCAQAVVEAMEQMQEASVGSGLSGTPAPPVESGFEVERVCQYLEENAKLVEGVALEGAAAELAIEIVQRLRTIASETRAKGRGTLEEMDRTLTVLEERLLAALLIAMPEEDLVALREQAARELAPYRGKMQAVQIKQVQQQFLQKRLMEARRLPRLSLFYMSHG